MCTACGVSFDLSHIVSEHTFQDGQSKPDGQFVSALQTQRTYAPRGYNSCRSCNLFVCVVLLFVCFLSFFLCVCVFVPVYVSLVCSLLLVPRFCCLLHFRTHRCTALADETRAPPPKSAAKHLLFNLPRRSNCKRITLTRRENSSKQLCRPTSFRYIACIFGAAVARVFCFLSFASVANRLHLSNFM